MSQIAKKRIRAKISGTSQRPRVAVYRSNRILFLQAIDDIKGHTLVAADSRQKDYLENFSKNLNEKKITKIVFDRSGYQYHGKIKEVAEVLRKSGLEF